MNMDKYKRGFTHNDTTHPMCEEEWIFSEKYSSESALVFQAYDANMIPLHFFSSWNLTEAEKQARIDKALAVADGFKGAVYLDDVKIKKNEW